jgi:hypothetical protein
MYSQAASTAYPPMKPLELALTPTRNRRLNEVTGMVLLVAASLLFLALASYRPTDPSLNTVGAAGTAGSQLDRADRRFRQRPAVAIGRGRRLPVPLDAGGAGVDVAAIPPCRFPSREGVRVFCSTWYLPRQPSV